VLVWLSSCTPSTATLHVINNPWAISLGNMLQGSQIKCELIWNIEVWAFATNSELNSPLYSDG
jgi:hypothetical protein